MADEADVDVRVPSPWETFLRWVGPPRSYSLTRWLILRLLVTDDAPFILELLNEPSFIRYIGDTGVRTLDDARAYRLLHGG